MLHKIHDSDCISDYRQCLHFIIYLILSFDLLQQSNSHPPSRSSVSPENPTAAIADLAAVAIVACLFAIVITLPPPLDEIVPIGFQTGPTPVSVEVVGL